MSDDPKNVPSRPTDLDRFLACLLDSELVDTRTLLDAIDGIRLRQYPQRGVSRLCEYFISRGALTAWQCEKLRNGRYKGFFIRQFRLLNQLPGARYLAADRNTHQRVILEIQANPSGPGTIEFKIIDSGALDWEPLPRISD
jgi:hypothetical protein